jgi:5'-deoxynucleotidase YfbR-like HD superfamily hydrolase
MFDRELRDLRHVTRWSVLRRNKDQSVAEHMYFVAIYAIEVAEFIRWGGDRYSLLRSAISHDIPEVWTGDTPGPSKHMAFNPEALHSLENQGMEQVFPIHAPYHRANGEIALLLAVADRLEAVMYLADELSSGNRSIGTVDNDRTPLGSNYARLRLAARRLPCQADVQDAILAEIAQAVYYASSGVSRVLTDPTP